MARVWPPVVPLYFCPTCPLAWKSGSLQNGVCAFIVGFLPMRSFPHTRSRHEECPRNPLFFKPSHATPRLRGVLPRRGCAATLWLGMIDWHLRLPEGWGGNDGPHIDDRVRGRRAFQRWSLPRRI